MSCALCGKAFCNRCKLNLHSKIHPQVVFKCDYHGKKFMNIWMLGRHQRGVVSCEKCEKKLCGPTSLSNHMMIRHRSVAFAICGKFVLMDIDCVECFKPSS